MTSTPPLLRTTDYGLLTRLRLLSPGDAQDGFRKVCPEVRPRPRTGAAIGGKERASAGAVAGAGSAGRAGAAEFRSAYELRRRAIGVVDCRGGLDRQRPP